MTTGKRPTDRPIIAVDIDDVLANHYEVLVDFYNQLYGTDLTIEDYFTNHWSEVWQLDHEETERRAVAFAESGLHADFDVKPGALEAIRALSRDYRLVICTARRKQNVGHTHDWLNKHFPGVFEQIEIVPIWEKDNSLTKADICQRLGASYLIDDSPDHLVLAAEVGIKGLLFGDYRWNRQAELPGDVTRVHDWQEVLEYFDAVRV